MIRSSLCLYVRYQYPRILDYVRYNMVRASGN